MYLPFAVMLISNYLLSDGSNEGSDIVKDHSNIEIPTSSENGQAW